MKKVKVAINGFGRIGRQVAKIIMDDKSGLLDLVAINDLYD
nr:glyceraldehyde 3-phosphate dehydrogenase NAD-binding domain-containing protein [Anaerolineaceae bacterium]